MDLENDQNPYQSPRNAWDGESSELSGLPAPSFRREKRRLLLIMLLVYAITGALIGALPADLSGFIEFAAMVVIVILTLRWCDYDRGEQEVERWSYFGIMMILCPGPLIVMPIYLLSTRGVRGLLSIAKAFVFFVILIAVGVLMEIAVASVMFP